MEAEIRRKKGISLFIYIFVYVFVWGEGCMLGNEGTLLQRPLAKGNKIQYLEGPSQGFYGIELGLEH